MIYRNMIMMTHARGRRATASLFRPGRLWLLAALLPWAMAARAQDSTRLSLAHALELGLAHSKSLTLSQSKVDEALAQYEQALDHRLPTIKASAMASEAFIPTRKFQLKGVMDEPMRLPSTSSVYLGTLSINEAIFAGHKLRYARQSADLARKIAGLDMQHDRQEILLSLLESYINLYKIDENLRIVALNKQDVEGRLTETVKFKEQGLATENDVLRFQLQKANVELTEIDLRHNREIANYALDLLLGLPGTTTIVPDSASIFGAAGPAVGAPAALEQQALDNRRDLATYQLRHELSGVEIKDLQADKLPTLGVGANLYYLNPNKSFVPPSYGFLVPVTLGLNLGWNISSLYTTGHRVQEAKVRQQQVLTQQGMAQDQVRNEVRAGYHHYRQALQRIEILHAAVDQARENDRIMELKYQNQLATSTDRIDAQSMLYQSLINLTLAQADARLAYFRLMESAGLPPPVPGFNAHAQ